MSTTQPAASPEAASAGVAALAAKMLAQANANAAANAPANPSTATDVATQASDPVLKPGAELAPPAPQATLLTATPVHRKRYYCSQENSTFVFPNGTVGRFAGNWYEARNAMEENELDQIVGKTHIHAEADAPLSSQELMLAQIRQQQAKDAAQAEADLKAALQSGRG